MPRSGNALLGAIVGFNASWLARAGTAFARPCPLMRGDAARLAKRLAIFGGCARIWPGAALPASGLPSLLARRLRSAGTLRLAAMERSEMKAKRGFVTRRPALAFHAT